MPFVQIPFLAHGKLDLRGDEINTVSQMNQLGSWLTVKGRIDFNDDWSMLRPPELNARRTPAKAESTQTAQRNIGDTTDLVRILRPVSSAQTAMYAVRPTDGSYVRQPRRQCGTIAHPFAPKTVIPRWIVRKRDWLKAKTLSSLDVEQTRAHDRASN